MTTIVDPPADRPHEGTTRPFFWSIRREIWEHRGIYLAPSIVASLFLLGYLLSLFRLSAKVRTLAAGIPSKSGVMMPFDMLATAVILTTFVVAVFYCLEALNSERRDRSILFWKSLPVSDRDTVLAKAAVPLVVLPAISFIVAIGAQIVMLAVSTFALLLARVNPVLMWSRMPLLTMAPVMLYGILIHALWFAPIYCWLLLVSMWAKRAAVLWAILPFFALGMFERMAFRTSYIGAMLKYRVVGAMKEGFSVDPGKTSITRFEHLSPLHFLSAPGLWAGLIFAAVCLVAAIRLRRRREPL